MELLIHTSDTFMFAKDPSLWTNAETVLDKASCMKQGFLQIAQPDGYAWGTFELDPKRFLIIIIPDNQFDPSWLSLDFTGGTEEEIADRKVCFPLDQLLTVSEFDALKNITFNEPAKNLTPIRKSKSDISSIVNTVDWANMPVRIKLHGSAGTFTVRPSGSSPAGDYTSLKTAVETEAADISAGSDDANFHIQHNGTDWAADTGNWDIDGWTMGTNKMLIQTQGDARHPGKPGSTKAHFIDNVTEGIDIEIKNVTLDGIEVINAIEGIEASASANGTTIKNCLVTGQSTDTDIGINIFAHNGTLDIINCIVNKPSPGVSDEGILLGASANGTISIFNCTVAGYADGIELDNVSVTVLIKNTAIFNNGDDLDDIGATLTMDFCATDDGDGTNSVDISPGGTEADDWNDAFTDYINDDLSVKNAASVIENAGTDLSGNGITDDIIGTLRPQDSTYDIGAFEFIVAAGGSLLLRNPLLTYPHVRM